MFYIFYHTLSRSLGVLGSPLMLERWLSIIVPILEKVFLPNLIRLEKEVMVILPGTCPSNRDFKIQRCDSNESVA